MDINTLIDHLDTLICDHNITINKALTYCFQYDCDNSEEIEKTLLEIKDDIFTIKDAISFIKRDSGYYKSGEE
jgi:hypothetical protein